MARFIKEIAYDIHAEWSKSSKNGVHATAVPYLHAMMTLYTINDSYFAENARSIVLYFLSNASTFRGEKAKELKNELKSLIK